MKKDCSICYYSELNHSETFLDSSFYLFSRQPNKVMIGTEPVILHITTLQANGGPKGMSVFHFDPLARLLRTIQKKIGHTFVISIRNSTRGSSIACRDRRLFDIFPALFANRVPALLVYTAMHTCWITVFRFVHIIFFYSNIINKKDLIISLFPLNTLHTYETVLNRIR